jgi:glycosyltransferase involved in cell wall biosynthesis
MNGQVSNLVNRGFEVVIISGPGTEIRSLCLSEQAKLYELDFTRSITPFHDLLQLFRIIRIVRSEEPDIVNAGNPKPGLLLTLACWLLRHRARLFTMHGLVSDSRSGGKGRLIALSEKLTCAMAHKVMVVSPSLARHAVTRGILASDKAVVIGPGSYNGIDMDRFSRTPEVVERAEALKRQSHAGTGSPVIGFVGRLTRDKGLGLLLQAFDRVRSSFPGVQLVLAGPSDPDEPLPEMQRIREDRSIRYLGNMPDIVPVYALMDILVLSSYREGFGNVLIEAASMELPVVAPAIPGCSDAVADGVNGCLFRRGDASSLADAVMAYVADPEKRERHGKAGRDFVTRFNRKEIWQGQEELYRSMMDK